MKKNCILSVVVLLITIGSSFQQVTAQEKTNTEMEIKIQKSIEQQKKAMNEQQKATEEANKIMEETNKEMDEVLKDIHVDVEDIDNEGKNIRIITKRGPKHFSDDNFLISSPDFMFNGHLLEGDSERTTWDFSRSVKENTFSKDYAFDVEKTVKTVVMSVMGDCKTGEIRIKIIMPNGKNYSDIVIDEFGNLNWRKSFTISETENQDKTGEWKFQIISSKATGFFKLSLQTY
jgi:hypothetical protein